jgi:hypothetical protein
MPAKRSAYHSPLAPSVDVQIEGMKDVMAALDKLDPKDQKKTIQKATADAAKKVLKPKVKAETPWPVMKRAVRAGSAKYEKPAGIVKYDNKRAWFRHFLVDGTKSHSTHPKPHGRKARARSAIQAFTDGGVKKFSRGHDVSGIKSNPVIKRVADQYGDAALDHVERFLSRQFGLDD